MPYSLDFHDLQVEQEVSATIQQNILEGMDLSDLSAARNIEQSKARITFSWSERASYDWAMGIDTLPVC
jgi:hypothetical protein